MTISTGNDPLTEMLLNPIPQSSIFPASTNLAKGMSVISRVKEMDDLPRYTRLNNRVTAPIDILYEKEYFNI